MQNSVMNIGHYNVSFNLKHLYRYYLQSVSPNRESNYKSLLNRYYRSNLSSNQDIEPYYRFKSSKKINYFLSNLSTQILIRVRSSSVKLDPEGRHRPFSNNCSATLPP